jgi:DNA-binding PadR family transcriptional regulator
MSDQQPKSPNPLTGLTGFQRDLLVVTARVGPCKGLEIKEMVNRSGYDGVTHGRLYPNLDILDNKGLLEKSWREPDKRSNTYELTAEGTDALESYIQWTEETNE